LGKGLLISHMLSFISTHANYWEYRSTLFTQTDGFFEGDSLPVLVEGGLLALGDLHAVIADGEVCVTGAEVAGKVRIKIELLKDFNSTTPLVENDNVLAVIYSHKSLDGAVSGAVEYLTRLIHEKTGKPEEEVIMLLSLVGEVKVSQVVDPLKTARLEVSKEVLDRYGFVL